MAWTSATALSAAFRFASAASETPPAATRVFAAAD
jgi:hypothetical protein